MTLGPKILLGVGVVAAMAAFTAVYLAVARRRRGEVVLVERRHASTFLLAAAASFGLVVSILDGPLERGRPGWAMLAGGIAILLAGSALRIAARRALGRNFSAVISTTRDQQLVTSGPYRFVRHPAYAGSILVWVGGALALGSWIGALATLVALVPAILFRISREEAQLCAHFGALYDDYARQTKKLVPGVL